MCAIALFLFLIECWCCDYCMLRCVGVCMYADARLMFCGRVVFVVGVRYVRDACCLKKLVSSSESMHFYGSKWMSRSTLCNDLLNYTGIPCIKKTFF